MTLADSPLLGSDAPVPIDRPFTRSSARGMGVTDRQLADWVAANFLISPMRGVFYAAQIPDGLSLRLACLGLVVPEGAVVTGRTAGWLHGAPMILAPGDHRRVPTVEMHLPPGSRLRNPLASGGERCLVEHEVVCLGGIQVTAKLRTTVDLGRGLRREQAFAAMCAMTKVADFDEDDLAREVRERGRFAGYRGIRQARELASLVSPKYDSPPECILALAGQDHPGVPYLVPQHPVPSLDGSYFVDLAVPALKYGAEYKGEFWHDETRTESDEQRLEWLVEHEGWIIDEFDDGDVYGPGRNPGLRLRMGVERARRRLGGLAWAGQNRAGEPRLG